MKNNQVKIVTHNITVRQNDRSPKTVKTWMDSIKAAESIQFPNRVRLYDVYEMILLDAHLSGIVQKRIDTVLNKRLLFTVDDECVEGMEEVIKSKCFRDIIAEILLSKFWGISGLEFVPGEKISFYRIPRKHIRPDIKTITIEQSGQEGFNYEKNPNIFIVGDRDDLGLLMKCGFYALLKKGAVSDWSQYIEIYGSPVMIAKYDAGDTTTENALDKILDNAGNSMRIKMPKQAEFDMKDGKASNGDGKLHQSFVDKCDQQMSIVILGATETTTSSKSSGFAQSKTHSEQQQQIIKADMVDVLDVLNSDQFRSILLSYNLPVQEGMFEYDKEVDVPFLSELVLMHKELYAMGLPIPHEYLYETYGIPAPEQEAAPMPGAPAPQPDQEEMQNPDPSTQQEVQDLSDNKTATIGDIKKMLSDFFALAL